MTFSFGDRQPEVVPAELGKLYLLGKQNVSSVVIKAGAIRSPNTP